MRARNFVGCVRARGLPARQPARVLISRALWLLNARPVAKTDALIVFLSELDPEIIRNTKHTVL